MSKKTKGVIFDLDDTLIDNEQFKKDCGDKVFYFFFLKKFNSVKKFKKIEYKNVHRKNFISNYLKKKKLPFTKKIILDIFNSGPSNYKISHNTFKILYELKKKYKLGLITDGNYLKQFNKIYNSGLIKIFDKIIINEKKKNFKPNSVSYKQILKKLNILPQNSIYVGDNPFKDFAGAKKIGMKTIRIKRGKYKYQKGFKSIDTTISSISSLQKNL